MRIKYITLLISNIFTTVGTLVVIVYYYNRTSFFVLETTHAVPPVPPIEQKVIRTDLNSKYEVFFASYISNFQFSISLVN